VVEQNRFGTIVPGLDEEPLSSFAQPPDVQPASPQPGYAFSASSYAPPSYPPPSYPPPTQSAYSTYPPPSYPPPAAPTFGGAPAQRSARTGWIVGIGSAVLVVVAVLVAIAVPVVQEQQAKAAAAAVQAQGYQLARVSPGVLGGRMECGSTADDSSTICGFTDSGALGAVVVAGYGDAARQLALVVRSAVERRS
jgi:hypothetical protein